MVSKRRQTPITVSELVKPRSTTRAAEENREPTDEERLLWARGVTLTASLLNGQNIGNAHETGIELVDVVTSTIAKKLLEETLQRPVTAKDTDRLEQVAQHILGWAGFSAHLQTRSIRGNLTLKTKSGSWRVTQSGASVPGSRRDNNPFQALISED